MGTHGRSALRLGRLAVAGIVLALAASHLPRRTAAAAGEDAAVPRILWAQRESMLYLRLVLPDLDASSLDLDVNDTHVVLRRCDATSWAPAGGAEGGPLEPITQTHAVVLPLYRRIEAAAFDAERESGALTVRADEVLVTLVKKWHARYWPRLLHDAGDPATKRIATDWKRWKAPENDDDGGGAFNDDDDDDDNGYGGSRSALAPRFAEEAIDDAHVPLLDASTFKRHLSVVRPAQLTLVHFFERNQACGRCRHIAALFAVVAEQVAKQRSARIEARRRKAQAPPSSSSGDDDGDASDQPEAQDAALESGEGRGNAEAGSEGDEEDYFSFARVDGRASPKLTQGLHVLRYPSVKLFLKSGEVFDVDMTGPGMRTPTQLQHYLVQQMQPELWPGDGGGDDLRRLLSSFERVAILITPSLPQGGREAE